MRDTLDRLSGRLAWLVVRIFFRRVEIEGLEHLPAEGPVLLVANHPNGLVDPILLVGVLPRAPRFLAKHTLWRNPVVRPLLWLGGVLSVRRQQDEGGDASRNDQTFARCHAELGRGGLVALFPEGLSHSQPELQPLRTGAARIALGARPPAGGADVRIVPVGLIFESRSRFRSSVLVLLGRPLDVAAWRAPFAVDSRSAVRGLTEQIRERLASVTLNFASWEDAALAERAAEIVTAPPSELPVRAPLAHRFGPQRRAPAGERLQESVRRYDAALRGLGLRDDQLAAGYSRRAILGWLAERLPLMALMLPVAAFGTALSWLPYRACGWIARPVAASPEAPASYKLLAGLLLLPLAWAAEAVVVGAWLGLAAGLALAVAAPLSSYVALLFHEQQRTLWREGLTWLRLRLRAADARALRAQRESLRRALLAGGEAQPPSPS